RAKHTAEPGRALIELMQYWYFTQGRRASACADGVARRPAHEPSARERGAVEEPGRHVHTGRHARRRAPRRVAGARRVAPEAGSVSTSAVAELSHAEGSQVEAGAADPGRAPAAR